MQSPSSLIFLVLLGVWAAFFTQYWLQRRDHLATARSVEQFSEAMRVLERRASQPLAGLPDPASASDAGHPARAARPPVLVARSVGPETASPVVGALTEHVESDPSAPEQEVREPARPRRGGNPSQGSSRRAGRGGRRRVRPSRRVRGLVFLAALVELVVIVPLVTLALLRPWALAPAVVAVVWAFLWVRSAVRAERALARASHRRPARGRTSSGALGAPGAGVAPAPRARAQRRADEGEQRRHPPAERDAAEPTTTDSGPEVSAAEAVATTAPGAQVGGRDRARTELFDVQLFDAQLHEARGAAAPLRAAPVMVPIMDEDDIPLTWDPVPVPRPTYTMKAKAERPEVAPAAVTPDPVAVTRDGTADGAGYDRRRVAGA